MKWRPEPDFNNRAHIKSLTTPTPAYCAICRRRAGPCGHGGMRIDHLWTCKWDECGSGISRLREMATADFDELELEALAEGAKAGLAYLKSLPETGALRACFAELEPDQAMEFLERIVDGFGAHLKVKLCSPGRK